MTHKFKFISLSFFLALSLLGPQLSYASESDSESSTDGVPQSDNVLLALPNDALAAPVEALIDLSELPWVPTQGILVHAARKVSPCVLARVCKTWRAIMRQNCLIEEKLTYITANPFYQNCIKDYWMSLLNVENLNEMDLICFMKMDTEIRTNLEMMLSYLQNPDKDIFNLPECNFETSETEAKFHIRKFMRSPDKFIQFCEKNQRNKKLHVFLIATYGEFRSIASDKISVGSEYVDGRFGVFCFSYNEYLNTWIYRDAILVAIGKAPWDLCCFVPLW